MHPIPAHRSIGRRWFVALPAVLGFACADRGGSPVAATPIAPSPEVVGLWPLFERQLDRPIWILFTEPLDPASIDATTVRIEAVAGPGLGRAVEGTYRLRSLPDGTFVDSVIEFAPEVGAASVPDSGAFLASTSYVLRLPAGGVADLSGRRLATEVTLPFHTIDGTSPDRLFTAGITGGPAVVSTAPLWTDAGDRMLLGTLAQPRQAVRVTFDQPLDPRLDNLPRQATAADRGAIWLEYDDPARGVSQWIDCAVELIANTINGAVVDLHPRGVLPSAAIVRAVMRGGLRDNLGEVAAAGATTLGLIPTEPALAPQRTALALPLRAEVAAPIEPMRVAARFDDRGLHGAELSLPGADGLPVADWEPFARDTVLDTDSDVIADGRGGYREVRGGVFRVRNLYVPAGYRVRGHGSNPLVFVVSGDARIDGEISVRGGNATLQPRIVIFPPRDQTPDTTQTVWHLRGRGACGGFDGADSSLSIDRTFVGHGLAGGGPLARGGRGGLLGCPSCGNGSGGGGGGGSTLGDPGYQDSRTPSAQSFQQRQGAGGRGCTGASGTSSRTLLGGGVGTPIFIDPVFDNDFVGIGYDVSRSLVVRGELPRFVGGAGGGSGGDQAGPAVSCVPMFAVDGLHGGAGGAGGGVLELRVAGTLTIGRDGRLDASGGDGKGDPLIGATSGGGGGGGGSGGAIGIQVGERILLHAHGETFAQHDYDFAIAADGGITTDSVRLPDAVQAKYPANGQLLLSAAAYDNRPRGGFGGLGLVQFSTPIGTTNDDDTNTILDDAVDIVRNGVALGQFDKTRYLAWRGMADTTGAYRDDVGNATAFAWGEGDVRPSPVLLPSTFSTRSTARTDWIELGAVDRRPLSAPDGAPRGVVNGGTAVGPDFVIDQTDDGWLRFDTIHGEIVPGGPVLLSRTVTAIEAATAADEYVIHVAGSALGTDGRYRGALVRLANNGGFVLGHARVLDHGDGELRVRSAVPLRADIAAVDLLWFPLDIADEPIEGYRGIDGRQLPRTNVRIGFAFHRAPDQAVARGLDPQRFPEQVGTYVYRLDDPAIAAQARALGATHVQCEIVVDRRYRRTAADPAPVLDAASDLHVTAVWLPFRF